MNPRDRLRTLADGVACAACRQPVPVAGVRLLAQRDDLAFVESRCPACATVGLTIIVDATGAAARVLDDAMEPQATTRPPVGPDDVLDMHLLLASWQGSLRGLVEHARARTPEPGR